MPREHFRVKPYSDRRYKFVVRAKVDGKWRRRYFRNETEAQAYADKQNQRVHAKAGRSRGHASKNGRRGGAKELSSPVLASMLPQSSRADPMDSKAPKIAHYLGGAWRTHLPFAHDLIRELKPSIFVELGVYKGESYFTFCQSVEENNLGTRCFGIDTWQGDPHAGLYGPEIGRAVADYNARYARFSHLMRMTFREALAHFEDGSVDLLHIDGAHRYEEVKEDFESWRPKLSSGAVVLFHDVIERDRGFGVYKLWQEIARPQASFLFGFGHGLGVWREKSISRKDPPFLQKLFLADAETKRAIVEHYATLAAAIEADMTAQRMLQTAEADLQVYPTRQGAACEEHVSRSRLEPGRWGRLRIDLPWGLGDGTAPCRIDPINSSGVVDVAAIRLRSAATGEFLWRADAKDGLDGVVAGGTSFSIPNPRFLRLLSYGPDPQIHLPSLPGKEFQDPLVFDIVLRYELGAEAMGRAIAALGQSAVFSRGAVSPTEVKTALPETAAEMLPPRPDSEIDQADRIQMTIYSAGESGYSEDRASEVTYTGECWSHLDIALQLGLGSKPLRLDPLKAIGLIDVASMTIRSAINDEVLWRINGGGGLESLQVSGSAVRIPHPHLARILSYGEDPQIYLPAFPSGKFDGPLRLEVWLKTETGIDSIRKGISELAAISSRALAQDSETRGLLEETTRDASSKDSEIQSLRAELERVVSERDIARAEGIEEKQQYQRTLQERTAQQSHIRNLEASRTEREIELGALKSVLETVQAENASQKAHIENLETIQSKQQVELGTLRSSLEMAQSENASQKTHIENLETLRVELESELTRAQDDVGALKNSFETVRSENATQQAQIEDLKATRRELESDLTKARGEMDTLKDSFEAVRSENATQQAQIRELEATRGQLESDLTKARSETGALKGAFEAVRSENATQQAQIENLEAIRMQLESDLTKLRESLLRARKETAQFITQLEAERVYRTNLQGKIKGFENRLRQSEDEAENLKAALAADRRQSENKGESLKAALAASKREGQEKLETLKANLEVANAKLASASGELAKRASQLALIQHELTVARSLRAGTAGELDQVRAKSASAAHELSLVRHEVFQLRHQLLGQKNTSTELRLKLDAAKERLGLQQSELEQFKASMLWKATKPIQKVRNHFGKRRAQTPAAEARQTSDNSSYAFWLEHPIGPSLDGDNVVFSGWVIGPPQQLVYGVQAVVGGKIFPGEHGFERPDVGATHEGRVGATHAGFTIVADLPPGHHDVSFQALNNEGQWKEFLSHSHSVNGPPPPHAGALELPGENTPNETGLLCVAGWIYFHEDEVVKLWANLKGAATNFLTYGLAREDIAKILAGAPAAGTSGFEGYLPLEPGFSGSVTVEVYARLKSGAEVLCFEREVSLQPLSVSPVRSDMPPRPVALEPYEAWLKTNKLTPVLLEKMADDAKGIVATGPLISVIVPVYNTPEAYLKALIESLRSQIYPKWQLCLADDASSQEQVGAIIEKATRTDPRIKSIRRPSNGHIAEASNSALELAEGDYIGLLDHDDLLTPDALLQVAEAISLAPAVDFLYTDEDKLSGNAKRYDPIFKGAFSPEMSITHNYLQHFAVIRKSLVRKVGGFRASFEGAQDLDLYLRVLEQTTPGRVQHLPFVCYHWRAHAESTASTGAQKTYVFDSAEKSISEALRRRNLRAAPFLPPIAAKNNCCLYQLRWSKEILKENPVTIVIPTKNRGDLLEKCIASLERTVNPAAVSLIVVDDFSEEAATRRYLDELQATSKLPCTVIQPRAHSAEFNFSKLVNDGVARATTPLVLLLNNDTEALEAGWLEDMAGWMSVDGVAAVGAKLLYPDGTIQHAGVIVGSHGGLAEHIFHRLPKDVIGFNFLTHAARNVSAVTAACMLTSKAAFQSVNGFDEENFGMEYNDVDYCLRLGQLGKRIVFTPQAELLHHCGKSRGVGFRPNEHINFLTRYPGIKDAFYNESLDPDRPVALNPHRFVHVGRIGRLKLLLVSHNLNLEGAPKILFERASWFASVGQYEIVLVSAVDGPLRQQYEAAGVSVRIIENPLLGIGEDSSAFIERLRSISVELEAGSFDLIIANTLHCFWAVSMAKLLGLPVIWNVHESTTVRKFFPFSASVIGLIEDCFGGADRVAFEATATRTMFDRHERQENFVTIPGSVDVRAINEFSVRHTRESLRRKHGIDSGATVVSLIGTTCARKGQHLFVEAIRKLQSENGIDPATACFLMVGARESPYLDFLRDQLQASGVKNTFLIEEREDVYDFFCLSDIFVCASYQESFPRVILEAMAFKLGIVSADIFGVPEMISDGDEGFLVPAGDVSQLARRIRWLIEKPGVRKQLGARAHSKVTRLFNSATQLNKHLDLTKEVVARHMPSQVGAVRI